MDFLQSIIFYTFGWLLTILYKLTSNYGIALILFTIVTRAILFPLAIKQQRGTAEMARMRPKLEEIQKKYAKDKAKLNEATQKMYQEEGYNPLSGCLPMLVQLPLLLGLYQVISNPLTNLYGLTSTKIVEIAKIIYRLSPKSFINFDPTKTGTFPQTVLAPLMNTYHDKILDLLPHNITLMKFDFLSIDLTQPPGWKLSIYILIPILCYLTQFISSWLSIRMTSAANPQQAKGMNSMMIIFMPLLTTWFSVTLPSSLGFYWIVTNIIMIIQVLILNKFYHPLKLAKIAEEKASLKRQTKLDGQISETDKQISPGYTEQSQIESPKAVSKPNYKPSQNKAALSNNQKKKLKYNNKKRLAASRKNEKIDTKDI